MIFCKSFEVTKSYIIILSVDCNTHLHTSIKKNFVFLNAIIFRKNKGGGRSPSGGKTKFFEQTEISGRWGGRGFQNLAGWKKSASLAGIFNDFLFELKSKKLCNFKDGQFRIFEKHGCPPLWNEPAHKENFYLAC